MKRIFFLLIFLEGSIMAKDYFVNPILAGFYPDPSICKVGDDFYLVNSTFAYFPALPIFHSKDLVNWKLIGHAIDRREQLDLTGFGVSRGIFAPTIRYYNGTFYITCTVVDGKGNFVITSKKPEGPWSNPVWLPEVNGIDPSLFFDEDGKAYLTYNSGAPNDRPLYEGHRTIRIVEFDYKNLRTVGTPKIIVNGGVNIATKPIWIEGPHIYKVNGLYYLTCAEGGTAEDHRQVIFRSKNVYGPYEGYPFPILTQKHLPPSRKFPVTCTGHADFVQLDNGDWWTVFLGCRPYEPFYENYYNTGRETFLAKIRWNDGWPIILEGSEEVKYFDELPLGKEIKSSDIPYSGNFKLRFDFTKGELHPSFIFLRTPREKWFELNSEGLTINLRRENCAQFGNPSFIGRRLQHSKGYIMTKISFLPEGENEKAGLLIFQDEEHFYFFSKSKKGNKDVLELYQSDGNKHPDYMKLLEQKEIETKKELILKIEFQGRYFAFYYGYDENDLILFKDKIDATFLSIRKAWGFTGNILAMYGVTLGKDSKNKALYHWFEYEGNDDCYKVKK